MLKVFPNCFEPSLDRLLVKTCNVCRKLQANHFLWSKPILFFITILQLLVQSSSATISLACLPLAPYLLMRFRVAEPARGWRVSPQSPSIGGGRSQQVYSGSGYFHTCNFHTGFLARWLSAPTRLLTQIYSLCEARRPTDCLARGRGHVPRLVAPLWDPC